MTNGFDNGPIRRYKKKQKASSLRTAAVLAMTVILLAALVVFIMSLTGTGLFADKDTTPVADTTAPGGTTDPSGPDATEAPGTTDPSGTEPPATSEDDPTPDNPNAIRYTYLDKNAAAIGEGLLVLINEDHPYTFPASAGFALDILGTTHSPSYEINGYEMKLNYKAIAALNDMADDLLEATGYTQLLLAETYRTYEYQETIWNGGKNPNATPPGGSDYHSGATFRLSGWDKNANDGKGQTINISGEAAQWLRANAHKYGFIFRSPSDKKATVGYNIDWQLRYVGLPHAQYMHEQNLCLEEYLDLLSSEYDYANKHLMIEGLDNMVYEVFYVKGSTEGVVRLPVPANRAYTVSGNNIDGFIITVSLTQII